jgi:hypothetical protein
LVASAMRKAWANAAKLASEKSVAWATLWIKFPVLIVMEGRPSAPAPTF